MEVGDHVQAGDVIVILEAMKMETAIAAPARKALNRTRRDSRENRTSQKNNAKAVKNRAGKVGMTLCWMLPVSFNQIRTSTPIAIARMTNAGHHRID